MNEYDFNIETIEEADGSAMNNTNYTPGNSPAPKKPKKHTALKIAASFMAMAVVSAGSIGIYHQLFVAPSIKNTAETEVTAPITNTIEAENVGMIHTNTTPAGSLSSKDAIKKVIPAVVGIESKFTLVSQNYGGFFGFGGMQTETNPVGTGTGVVISEDGYIVTNAHVIFDSQYGAGEADSVSVLLSDETRYDAEIVGFDTDCDLAVIKIEAEGLTPAEFGDSDSLELGDDVIAIGNPLGFDLRNTVTRGCVSGLNRNITINEKNMNLIQTDAAINSGNSGGPLINSAGQVVGINSSKMSSNYSSSEASIEGIGFAIPSNEVSAIVEDFINYGYVTGKPQLGISCQNVTETISQMYNMPVGIYIVDVSPNGAADKAGLKKGDIITAVDDVKVETSDDLNAQKNLHKAGEEIKISYVRNGEEAETVVTLDEMTENQ